MGVGKHTAADTGMLTQVELLPHDPVDVLAHTSQMLGGISFLSLIL